MHPILIRKGENVYIMKRYEVTNTIQGLTENECYKELWCAVVLQAVLDLESENKKDRESALYFLNSFEFGKMILKRKCEHNGK